MSEPQLLTQDKDLGTAIVYLSYNMSCSKFLASATAEEALSSSSPFLSSLEIVVRSIRLFNVFTACRLSTLMARTTLHQEDCVRRSMKYPTKPREDWLEICLLLE